MPLGPGTNPTASDTTNDAPFWRAEISIRIADSGEYVMVSKRGFQESVGTFADEFQLLEAVQRELRGGVE